MGASEKRSAPSRFFIAGATGYTGQNLVRVARARGIEVIAHIRPTSSQLETLRPQFTELGAEVDLTPWSAPEMARCLQHHRPTHIFALRGTTRMRGRRASREGNPKEDYQNVDYGLTAMLLTGAQSFEPAPIFIYLSARGVSPKSRLAYMAARAQLEAELPTSGLPHIIARPGFISGADRDEWRPGERTVSLVSDTILSAARLFGARRLYEAHASLTGEELARGLCGAALAPQAIGREIDVTQLRNYSAALDDPNFG